MAEVPPAKRGKTEAGNETNVPEAWLDGGHKWIGQRLTRKFPTGLSSATVTKWLPAAGRDAALWHVKHDDGDEEDLEEHEVEAALVTPTPATNKPKSPVQLAPTIVPSPFAHLGNTTWQAWRAAPPAFVPPSAPLPVKNEPVPVTASEPVSVSPQPSTAGGSPEAPTSPNPPPQQPKSAYARFQESRRSSVTARVMQTAKKGSTATLNNLPRPGWHKEVCQARLVEPAADGVVCR